MLGKVTAPRGIGFRDIFVHADNQFLDTGELQFPPEAFEEKNGEMAPVKIAVETDQVRLDPQGPDSGECRVEPDVEGCRPPLVFKEDGCRIDTALRYEFFGGGSEVRGREAQFPPSLISPDDGA